MPSPTRSRLPVVTSADDDRPHRLAWAVTRAVFEADSYKHRKFGERRLRRWSIFERLIQLFGAALRRTHLYDIGRRNARRIVVNRLDLPMAHLPAAFHGYTILHMTDLHLDFMPGMDAAIRDRIRHLEVDLCVLTGDYRARICGGFKNVLAPMQRVVDHIHAADGIIATLGNHDTYQMAAPFERMGLTVLANETVAIERPGGRVLVTGLDDPYYYYTDQAMRALEETPEAFKIALVHTPSLFDIAADNGYRLYLCGHTHGGQICLPGGRPVILHLRHGRHFYRGLWRYGQMVGYTGQGTGVVGIPIRFNTQSEITLLRLLRE